MYYPESEKLLAELPSKEDDITAIDHLLYNNQGKVIIVANAAFLLDLSEQSLTRFLTRYEQLSIVSRDERGKCPICENEIMEATFSPDRSPWYCDICGKDFLDDQVEKVDCFKVRPASRQVVVVTEAPLLTNHNTQQTSPLKNNGAMNVNHDQLLHGKTNPWNMLDHSEYMRVITTFGAAEHEWVLGMLQSRGFCMIRFQGLTPSRNILTSIEDVLGPARPVQNGYQGKIKEITPDEAVAANTGDSAKALSFHTDGTQDTPLPPAILVFQYLTTPTHGGLSTFLDLTNVILEMSDTEQADVLTALAHFDAATSAKKGLSYTGPLVVPVCADQSLSFRLRFDEILTLAQPYQQAFDILKKRILDRADYLTYSPQEGDIAIFDNWRVLHGRKSLEGSRHLRFHNRMWIDALHKRHTGKYLLGVRGLSSELLIKIKQTNNNQT
jgi:alpha-ketoglutarate-dependent taurine dioxygenase